MKNKLIWAVLALIVLTAGFFILSAEDDGKANPPASTSESSKDVTYQNSHNTDNQPFLSTLEARFPEKEFIVEKLCDVPGVGTAVQVDDIQDNSNLVQVALFDSKSSFINISAKEVSVKGFLICEQVLANKLVLKETFSDGGESYVYYFHLEIPSLKIERSETLN